MEDRTEAGRKLRILTAVDEFTRECLAVEMAYRMNAKFVAGTVQRLLAGARDTEVRLIGQRAGVHRQR